MERNDKILDFNIVKKIEKCIVIDYRASDLIVKIVHSLQMLGCKIAFKDCNISLD